MNRLTPGFCVAAILVVASSFGQSPPTVPRSISNSIDVFVTTSTGSPLADADVFITPKPAPLSDTSNAKTGIDGHAIFRNLPAGTFDVRVERQGYMPVRSDAGTASAFTISVELGSSTQSTTRQIKVPLIGGAIISGRVENPSGRPAAGVGVGAMQMRYQNGEKRLWPSGALGAAAVRTDDRGEFRIFWLAPGDYYLHVDRPEPQNDRSFVANFFYPGVTDLNSATRVRVREGEEAGGLRIVLAPPSGVKLSGTVTNTIKDAEPYKMVLTAEDPIHKSQSIGFKDDPNASDSDFSFEISDVPPGNYELHAQVRSKPYNENYYTATTRLTVGSQDVRNIQITVRKGGDLQVGVSVPPEVQSYIRNLPRRPDQEQPLRIVFQPEVSSEVTPAIQLQASEFENNSMTFSESNVVPGRYRLILVRPLPPDAYIGDLRQNGQTVYDGVIDVSETPASVLVSIARNGGTIQGNVTAPTLEAQNYIAVVLIPDVPRRGNVLLYKRLDISSIPTDPSQFRFSFVGVAPGNYKVIAVDTLLRGSEMDPDVVARYESRAVAVSVTQGATRDIQVPLIRTR